jgi:hypothetical protein
MGEFSQLEDFGRPIAVQPVWQHPRQSGAGLQIKTAAARAWHEWLTSAPGRAAIRSFRLGGQQAFFPILPPV